MCLKLRLRSSASAEGELPLARSLKKVHSSLNVEEEYNKALHTKSFVDIWKKAHHQLKRTTSTTTTSTSTSTSSGSSTSPRREVEEEGDQECSSNMTSPLSLSYYSHLPDFILDPCQETLISATSKDGRLRNLLIEFFDTTLEACNACTSLLACIDRTRTHHGSLRRLLHQARDTSTFSANLAAHLNLDNPLSATNLACFHRAHALFGHLILRLATAHRRILKRARIIRLTKKATGYSVVAVCGAAAAVVVVVAVHSVVGLAFMPVAVVNVACGVHNHERVAAPHSFAGKLSAAVRKRVGSKYLEKAGATVDAAAKGAYIVGRDLDTVSRMVARLHGEVEHDRDVVRMVMRNKEPELVKEVAREMESGEEGFGEQLAELEEHVYLCLLTMNRSRRMVAEAMGGGGGGVAPPAPMA